MTDLPAPVDGARPADVAVSGGRGVIVGNYGTVFQNFGAAATPISSFIRSAQFAALVDERSRTFIGREFVFDEIDRLLGAAEFDSGYIVIKGEPGIGKTAIAASLVVRGGYVHHFNIAAENIRTATQFLQNVCAQLIVRYDLPYQTLPDSAATDSGFLGQLLQEAAEVGRARGQAPLVVVVDAIDEADRTELGPSANRLLLPRLLPPGVFFILTAREETDYRLDVDHQADIWIRDDDLRNRADVEGYIRQFVADHAELGGLITGWQIDTEKFVQELATRSEGNFMYLVHVLPDIARGRLGLTDDHGLAALPTGLDSYYRRHWRDMKDADVTNFTTRQRPVLCFLAISREPVTVVQLTEWTNLEPADVRLVIDQWREFLNEDLLRPPHYRLYHRSFADFLDETETLRWYHDQIVRTALAKIPGFLSPG